MAKTLSKTVLAGGVVYPAGTPATPELEQLVTDQTHWTGTADDKAPAEKPTAASSKPKRTRKRAESSEA